VHSQKNEYVETQGRSKFPRFSDADRTVMYAQSQQLIYCMTINNGTVAAAG